MSKIAVITGSARKDGNSNKMAAAFMEVAKAKGNEVIHIDAASLSIGGCHGCETCYSQGRPCTFDDDFNKVAPDILAADALVFATPVYWYSYPSQIKAVIDKMFSLVVGGKDISGKKVGLIACCEEHDKSVLDGVRVPFERTAALNKWQVVGEVLITGVLNKGDIDKTDGVSQAAALAEKF